MDPDEITERYKPFRIGNCLKPSPEEVRVVFLKLWSEAHDSIEYNKDRWQAFEIMLELYTGIAADPNKIKSTIVPIDMILFCPRCNFRHIDKPEPDIGWENPPHRSHLCHSCGNIWRPANIYTNGVESICIGDPKGIENVWSGTNNKPVTSSTNEKSSIWSTIKKFFRKKGKT